MIISIQKSASTYYQLAKQMPAGFKNVFVETKDGMDLRKLRYNGKPLSRRQELTLKKNSEALSKLFLFALTQTVPIAGWIPLIVAVTYPRYLLTTHFWSAEQKVAFMAEEYAERCLCSTELRRQVTLQATVPASFFYQGGKLSTLDNLSAKHIELLAGANAVHGNILTQTFTPSFISRIMLKNVAAFIMKDDLLLRAEGVEDLSEDEVKEALLQRGLPYIGPVAADITQDVSPDVPLDLPSASVFSSDLDQKEALKAWLMMYDVAPIVVHSTVSAVPIGEDSSVPSAPVGGYAAIGEVAVISPSYLLHSIALPEIRLQKESPNRQVRF